MGTDHPQAENTQKTAHFYTFFFALPRRPAGGKRIGFSFRETSENTCAHPGGSVSVRTASEACNTAGFPRVLRLPGENLPVRLRIGFDQSFPNYKKESGGTRLGNKSDSPKTGESGKIHQFLRKRTVLCESKPRKQAYPAPKIRRGTGGDALQNA
jgi:hypothetical protein